MVVVTGAHYFLVTHQLLQAVMQEFTGVAKGSISDTDLARAKLVSTEKITFVVFSRVC